MFFLQHFLFTLTKNISHFKFSTCLDFYGIWSKEC